MVSMIRQKNCMVIGNGFDLNLGFKTKYSDFAASEEWENMLAENKEKCRKGSLMLFLDDKRKIDNWFDIEALLLEFATSDRTNRGFVPNAEEDYKEFLLICDALKAYLTRIVELDHKVNNESVAVKVIEAYYREYSNNNEVFSFNYTPIERILKFVCHNDIHSTPFVHLHGSVLDDSLILGIESESPLPIIPGYSFLFKTNSPHYKSIDIERSLLESEEVIIFGHSLNQIDAPYFKPYLQMLEEERIETIEGIRESQGKIKRRLTIITYDDNSDRVIRDNIRAMGISLQRIFNHATVEFIKTKDVAEGGNDANKLETLLERLKL